MMFLLFYDQIIQISFTKGTSNSMKCIFFEKKYIDQDITPEEYKPTILIEAERKVHQH